MRVVGALLSGCVLGVLVIGLALYPMLAPGFTNALAKRYSLVGQTGLPGQRVYDIAEQVRAFVADEDSGPLPATVDGRPGFDAAAVSHLRDVRGVLSAARTVAGLLAAVVVVALATLIARQRFLAISNSLLAGAGVCALVVVLAALAANTNFEAFFAWFHGLFFSAGSWEFPANSLLIEVFPEGFWMATGVAWGGLVLLGGAVLGVAGWLVRGAGTSAVDAGAQESRLGGT